MPCALVLTDTGYVLLVAHKLRSGYVFSFYQDGSFDYYLLMNI